ncbi:NUDIX hydrolase domain-like protein [Dendryphion nanum]|uniref:NUDIX hydrolase domain-like protein n=1 Tax=Dendryphion nanum TaxID=256645 RepID=A0A9P9CYQ7_9PLEO|nr:NUDIX hydrolase domain-like protein [Dendryphion nanum]
MACEGHHPRVAVIAVISDREGRIVTGRRLGPLGTGQFSFPGGHLDQGEDLFTCAERETFEETGLKIHATKIIAVTNDWFVDANKHYVSIFVQAKRVDAEQEPQTLEPNKCEAWIWKSWQEIRSLVNENNSREVFLPVANLVRQNSNIESMIQTKSG